MCAIPSRARARRSSAVRSSRSPTSSKTSRACSATMPERSPSASRANRPSGGSGVSRVTPASANAVLLNQLVCPPRCATFTGWSGTAASRWVRCSGPSTTFVSSNMKPRTHRPGGVSSALARRACWISADRPQVRVHAVELVHAARVGVRVDEPRRDGHPGGVDELGLRADEIADVSCAAHGGEPATPDRERLGARQRLVDGVDAGVDDRQVRAARLGAGLLCRGTRRPGQAGPAGQHGAEAEKLLA